MKYLSLLWVIWKRFGFLLGNLVSTVFLTVFYFTIFALFAIPYKTVLHFRKSSGSNFKIPRKQISAFDDFQKEF